MKMRYIISCCSLLIACSGGDQKDGSNTDTTISTNQTAKAVTTDVDTNVNNIGTNRKAGAGSDDHKGDMLMASSDCKTCHKMDVKLIGPSFLQIAEKYEATSIRIDSLAQKIIKGGVGVWGEIPMAPHPTITHADAQEMVKYILSLKK